MPIPDVLPASSDELRPGCELARLRDAHHRADRRLKELAAKRTRWQNRIGECERAIADADPDHADFAALAAQQVEAQVLRARLEETASDLRFLDEDARRPRREWQETWAGYLELRWRVLTRTFDDLPDQPTSERSVLAELERLL